MNRLHVFAVCVSGWGCESPQRPRSTTQFAHSQGAANLDLITAIPAAVTAFHMTDSDAVPASESVARTQPIQASAREQQASAREQHASAFGARPLTNRRLLQAGGPRVGVTEDRLGQRRAGPAPEAARMGTTVTQRAAAGQLSLGLSESPDNLKPSASPDVGDLPPCSPSLPPPAPLNPPSAPLSLRPSLPPSKTHPAHLPTNAAICAHRPLAAQHVPQAATNISAAHVAAAMKETVAH
eukprot:CAMPEP_0172205522 /NCGR_PEP_ID=MMETSP1050-20130122/32666_1 /TAXON_ID=233186 /ORGANISM="Cryptomonas curvata, Strain CCAP979/52" /LENGTH=238 /DNA_ID=CAMNT_0012884417 /DNA_START=404 /DNA_END=1118 /DNA_ORIENTATION=+